MNMKRIVFKIAKSFCACFITLLFFSCSNSESVMEKERKSTVIIDIKQNGLGYELKSKEVPYITRASGRNIEQFYLPQTFGFFFAAIFDDSIIFLKYCLIGFLIPSLPVSKFKFLILSNF